MNNNNYESVGILIVAKKTNRFLLLHRVNPPAGTWSCLAGGMEKGEKPMETIKREILEEIGIHPMMIDNIQSIGVSHASGHKHYMMIGFVDNEFKINNLKKDENDKYGWFSLNNLPKPLHPGLQEYLDKSERFLKINETIKNNINKLLKESDNHDYSWVNDYLNQQDPLEPVKEFIYNKLKDCELLPSEKRPGWTKYIDHNGDILFVDEIDTGDEYPYLYADHDKIWLKCKEMGCSLKDFQKICKDMLYEVHKRKVHTAYKSFSNLL